MKKAETSVLFDHGIFTQQVHGGISLYVARLVAWLPTFGVRPRIVAPIHINPAIARLPSEAVSGVRVAGGRVPVALARRLAPFIAAPFVKGARADVHHETYYSAARLARLRTPVVVTVHDMIHELRPEFFGDDDLVAIKRASIERADAIICISENTRRDLLRFYPSAHARTVVIHHGVDPADAGVAPSKIDRPYLLFVGLRGGYKNFAALLQAYAASSVLRTGFDLVCVGPPFDAAERDSIDRAGLAGSVRREAASESRLRALYRGAAAFVYPSLYEGFGMPPLEAMAAGCPVVCVRVSSLPEVCGDAAEFAEDGSPDALRHAIESVIGSESRRTELVARGLARAAAFSWQRCAERTAEVYRWVKDGGVQALDQDGRP